MRTCTSTWTSRSCPRGGISVTEVRGTRPASENCSRTYATGSMQVDIPVIVQRSGASSRCSTFVLDSRLFYDDAGRCTKGSIYISGFHFLFRKEKERERAGRNRFRGGRPGRAPRRGRDRKRTSAGMSCCPRAPRVKKSQHHPAPTPVHSQIPTWSAGRIHLICTGSIKKGSRLIIARGGVEISAARTSDRNGHEMDQKVRRDVS